MYLPYGEIEPASFISLSSLLFSLSFIKSSFTVTFSRTEMFSVEQIVSVFTSVFAVGFKNLVSELFDVPIVSFASVNIGSISIYVV